jgi:hypothetical protein
MSAVETIQLRREFATSGLRRGEVVVALDDLSLSVEVPPGNGRIRLVLRRWAP